jgi:hypothetical protein
MLMNAQAIFSILLFGDIRAGELDDAGVNRQCQRIHSGSAE